MEDALPGTRLTSLVDWELAGCRSVLLLFDLALDVAVLQTCDAFIE